MGRHSIFKSEVRKSIWRERGPNYLDQEFYRYDERVNINDVILALSSAYNKFKTNISFLRYVVWS